MMGSLGKSAFRRARQRGTCEAVAPANNVDTFGIGQCNLGTCAVARRNHTFDQRFPCRRSSLEQTPASYRVFGRGRATPATASQTEQRGDQRISHRVT